MSFGLRRERIAEVVQRSATRAPRSSSALPQRLRRGPAIRHGYPRDRRDPDGHTHDALPEPVQVGNTFLIASGSHGKFVSRVDLDVQDGAMRGSSTS
jgi:sulfur-oxidizing protein SoxB